MKRVLLVDDEFLVCSFLKQLINWEGQGYRIVGQAGNGRQALDMIEEFRPDLVFLDVSMPEMDGINLIRTLQKEHIRTCVVMLSSYSDYEYVRETMKLGARDYLLKHQLTAESLSALLAGLHLDADGEREAQSGGSGEEASFRLLRDSQTRSYFEGRLDVAPPALARLGEVIPVAAALRISLALSADGDVQQESYLIRRMLDTCVEVCGQRQEAKIVFLGGASLMFLFSARPGEGEEPWAHRVDRTMTVVRDALLKYHNTYIGWARGPRCFPEQLPQAHKQLLGELETAGRREPSGVSFRFTIEQERRLILSVLGKDRKGLAALLETLFAPVRRGESLEGDFTLLVGDLLSLTVKLYQEYGVPLGETRRYDMAELGVEQAQNYFSQLLVGCIDHLDNREQYSKTVGRVIDYVEEHYREDICLDSVGSYCGMNPSYLSSVFKRETAVGMSQYINRVRIYAAGKRMLMDGVTPTAVYEEVGFRNYNHFFNLFKEVTGMAPKQFREQATAEWIASFHPLKK